ncbi:hypothetical protein FRB99_000839 [Tulasnella sp. 403]|nr:hypothetical protein FRB99_000839 [Tulasnella sp. 403]
MDLDDIADDTFAPPEPQPEETRPAEPQPEVQLRPSLLTAVSELIASFDEKYPTAPAPSHLHPFSPNPPDTEILETILQVAGIVTGSLAGHTQSTDPRFVTRAQEYTNHAGSWLLPQMQARHIFRRVALQKRHYGADLPLEPALIPNWVIDEIMGYLKGDGGREAFKETEPSGRTTLTCGGKILVIDIEFRLHSLPEPSDGRPAQLQLVSVKTTQASSNNSVNASPTRDGDRLSLDGLLFHALDSFASEAQKPLPDCVHLRQLGETFKTHVDMLMTYDTLAHSDAASGTGDIWFKEVDDVEAIAVDVATKEVKAVAKSLGSPQVPLDIAVNRIHGLPMPYLFSPAMTFVVYLSGRAYLSLLRMPKSTQTAQNDTLFPLLDIPRSTLSSFLRHPSTPKSLYVCATLTLNSTPDTASTAAHALPFISPAFVLLSAPQPDLSALLTSMTADTLPVEQPTHGILDEHLNHHFPIATVPPTDSQPSNETESAANAIPRAPALKGFVLDFGSIVMRREAMYQLQSGDDAMALAMGVENDMSMMGTHYGNYGSAGWVDLLIDPSNTLPCPRYVSEYTPLAPTHPSLQHLLTPPPGPGYTLGKVRVTRMSEVWRVIEIVKEQAWLNDILSGFKWKRDIASQGPVTGKLSDNADKKVSDEEELDALLQGNLVRSCAHPGVS